MLHFSIDLIAIFDQLWCSFLRLLLLAASASASHSHLFEIQVPLKIWHTD